MITGHLGVAGALWSRSQAPATTPVFLALIAASVLPDVVDVAYVLAGICSPFGLYSHTLPALALEGAIVGGAAYLLTGSRAITVLLASAVLLHLPADFFTMRKLVMPGGEMMGLQLYERPAIDFILEGPVFAAGWWLMRRSARGPRWAASVPMLVAVIAMQGTFNVVAGGNPIKPNACGRTTP